MDFDKLSISIAGCATQESEKGVCFVFTGLFGIANLLLACSALIALDAESTAICATYTDCMLSKKKKGFVSNAWAYNWGAEGTLHNTKSCGPRPTYSKDNPSLTDPA
jgi:hypothetical protein